MQLYNYNVSDNIKISFLIHFIFFYLHVILKISFQRTIIFNYFSFSLKNKLNLKSKLKTRNIFLLLKLQFFITLFQSKFVFNMSYYLFLKVIFLEAYNLLLLLLKLIILPLLVININSVLINVNN